MRFLRPSGLFRLFFPEANFSLKTDKKQVCLTFDDGPDPSSTPLILEILKEFNVKAIFFSNGDKAEKNPELVNSLRSHGHIIGNHGYAHKDGWKTSCKKYIENAEHSDALTSPVLFRPPYGHLSPCQYSKLKKKYNIVMWDLMPYDFDRSFGIGNSVRVLRTGTRPGSIIVLHDTHSSCAKDLLREYIEYASAEGYQFVVPGSFTLK